MIDASPILLAAMDDPTASRLAELIRGLTQLGREAITVEDDEGALFTLRVNTTTNGTSYRIFDAEDRYLATFADPERMLHAHPALLDRAAAA